MPYLIVIFLILISLNSFSLECNVAKKAQENQFSKFKKCSIKQTKKCFGASLPHQELRKPFVIENQSSRFVMICVHGLSDSPYYFKDISTCLGEEVEFWGLRLTGHGADDLSGEAIKNGSWEKWEEQLECAIEQAQNRNKKVILCGLSTGGTLALNSAMHSKNKKSIKAVVLFSPAIELKSPIAEWAPGWLLGQYNFALKNPLKKQFRTCGRYDYIYSKGVSYLKKGISKVVTSKQKLEVPTFLYSSTDDDVVSYKASLKKLSQKAKNLQVLSMGKEKPDLKAIKNSNYIATKKKLNHSAILKTPDCVYPREKNPHFSKLCGSIKSFIKSL